MAPDRGSRATRAVPRSGVDRAQGVTGRSLDPGVDGGADLQATREQEPPAIVLGAAEGGVGQELPLHRLHHERGRRTCGPRAGSTSSGAAVASVAASGEIEPIPTMAASTWLRRMVADVGSERGSRAAGARMRPARSAACPGRQVLHVHPKYSSAATATP